MERKSWIRMAILGVLLIAILVGSGNLYLSTMQKSLWEQSVTNMLEVTTQGANSFQVYLEQGYTMLDGRAGNFAQYKADDVEQIWRKLDRYEEGDPSFAVIDLSDGTIYYNSEQSGILSDKVREMYLNLPDHGVLEPFLSEQSGLQVLGYYGRFLFADGTPGMVRKTVPLTEVAERFTLSFYDGAGFSYIVNAQGDILFRSVGKSGNRTFRNVFDVIELDNNTAEDLDTFRLALSDCSKGVMRLNFNGNPHIFVFVPVNINEDWYLISIVPNDVVMSYANRMMRSSQLMIGILVVAAAIYLSFVFMDARNRRQVRAKETEVLYREHLFNLLAKNTNDVFIMVASDGRKVEYVSPNMERVLGISETAVRKNLATYLEAIQTIGPDAVSGGFSSVPVGESVSNEVEYIHKTTGERRWFIETIYHTTLDGLERYIIALDDLTENRQKEAALSEALEIAKVANESKSTFLSNMSHDIRTPMNAIVGLTTLLQRDADEPEAVRQHTLKIKASSQHLLGLINDVLDMSKIESGKTTLNIGAFNLAEMVEELSTIIYPQAKAKKQTFEVAVKGVHSEYLLGDKLRINQVMINILSNAVKYTPEGGQVDFLVEQTDSSGINMANIRFTVKDNGIGMSEEYQREIFNPFTREVRTTVNRVQGTGLGMAITKSLVELMGGTITVHSKLNEGSTFIIELSMKVAKQEDDLNFWKDHGINRALIVDDEEDICTGVISAMNETGVDVEYALNGPDAIEMAWSSYQKGATYDLIILDWKMPEMNGAETARRIRSMIPSHIPIITLSSHDLDDILEEMHSVHIDGFLSKPFFLSNLKDAIRTVRLNAMEDKIVEEKTDVLKGRHFLCAEDNELNAEILEELLDMEGATCLIAVDGKEAVDQFLAAPEGTFDAILMDVQMPIMDGHEATRAIRKLDHPQAKSIPIVAMTANAFADDVRESLNAGMDAHIAKPIDMALLRDTLSKLWAAKNKIPPP